MAPSVGCTANLFCSEDVFGAALDDDNGSYCDDDILLDHSQQAAVIADPVDVEGSLSVLVEKEVCHIPQADYLQRFQDKTLDSRARQNAVSWLLKLQAYYSFGPLTAALSVNYLDRFLSRHQFPNGKAWMLQLLSVACLSIAAKMEETDVPLLLDLQVEPEYVFESRTIQRMELLVLSTLDWRMSSVTPFAYVDYFIHRFGIKDTAQRVVLARINELILSALRELRFLEHRPSAIAAAAALCAIEELLPVHFADCKRVLFSVLPIPKDSCERCFLLMAELFLETFLNGRNAACSSTSLPQSPVGVLDASFSCDSESTIRSIESRPSVHVFSSPASKRRRVDDFCSSLHPLESL